MFSKNADTTFDYEGGDLEAMMLAAHYYRWILDTVRPYIGENVVEVGAGVGSFSRLLMEAVPPKMTLVEPSKTMHQKLSATIVTTETTTIVTYNSYMKDLEKTLHKSKPDTFVYINVFEHIEDDTDEFKRLGKLLQKGGHAIVFVPALNGLYSDFDKSIGHYRRYTKKALRELCEAAGLEVVKLRYMDMPGVLPWWFSFMMLKRTALVPTLVHTYDNLCVPIIRVFEDMIEAPIGKNLLLVAKRP